MTAFTVSAGACSTVTYTLTNNDNSAIDASVFTFTASTPSLVVSTSSAGKIATYNLKLTGTLTGDATIFVSTVF